MFRSHFLAALWIVFDRRIRECWHLCSYAIVSTWINSLLHAAHRNFYSIRCISFSDRFLKRAKFCVRIDRLCDSSMILCRWPDLAVHWVNLCVPFFRGDFLYCAMSLRQFYARNYCRSPFTLFRMYYLFAVLSMSALVCTYKMLTLQFKYTFWVYGLCYDVML